MQAKKSVEKMHVLIRLRQAQLAKEANWVPPSVPARRHVDILERALTLPVNYCPVDFPLTETDFTVDRALLTEQFAKLDKGTLSEAEYKQLFFTIVRVQLAKGIVDIDTLTELQQKEVQRQKHYEEHSPQVETTGRLDNGEVLYPTESRPHRFLNVVYETLISPRCLFGFGR